MSCVNQWRDTDSVIPWFESIKNKNKCIFMQYDIEKFCLFIFKELLKKYINYGRAFADIDRNEECTVESQ